MGQHQYGFWLSGNVKLEISYLHCDKVLFFFFGKLQVLDEDNEVKLLFSRSRCGEVPVRHVVLGCVMGLVMEGAKGGPGNISILYIDLYRIVCSPDLTFQAMVSMAFFFDIPGIGTIVQKYSQLYQVGFVDRIDTMCT